METMRRPFDGSVAISSLRGARGWLSVIAKAPSWPGYQAASIEEVLRLVDEAESLEVDFRGADNRLRLTPQGNRDAEVLLRAS